MKHFILICLVLLTIKTNSQSRFYSKSGKIQFVAVQDPDVDAVSRSATVIFDIDKGALDFSILVKSFEFEKALMQEKFNNKILETDKYPKAGFKGIVSNNSAINYQENGEYAAEVKGQLTIHNVTRDIVSKGTIKIENGSIGLRSSFRVSLKEYSISDPGVGDEVKIDLDCKLEQLKD